MGQAYAIEIKGNLRQLLLDRFDKTIAPEIQGAVDDAAEYLQDTLRDQTEAAGLGQGLVKSWQLIPPGKKGYRFAALVYTKAKRLIQAFNQSFVITARAGHWLIIPLPAAIDSGWAISGSTRSGRAAGSIPPRWSNVAAASEALGRLRFVDIGGGRALLFPPHIKGEARNQANALFLLVKQTDHKKLLDIEAAASAAVDRLKDNLDKLSG